MRLRTAKTSGLVRELLTKLDSADFYAARKEAEIEEYKKQVESNRDYHEQYDALYKVAENYSHYCIDSSLVYFNRAVQVAADADDELLRIYAQIRLSTMLTIGGFYMCIKHSETLEDMVVYQAMYGERGIWVRPLAMFEEEIERDGKTVRRFSPISSEDAEKEINKQ
jgi:hypothetical protein